MSDKDKDTKKPLPLHEALPDLIIRAAADDDFAGYMRLLDTIEKVAIPLKDKGRSHEKIIAAINDGRKILAMELERKAIVAEATLQTEIAKFEEAVANQESQDATPEEKAEMKEVIPTTEHQFPTDPVKAMGKAEPTDDNCG